MTDLLHTVVVSLPGTHHRVLVEHLPGTPDEACRAAKEAVYGFAAHAPVRWRTAVLRTEELTDVHPHPETF